MSYDEIVLSSFRDELIKLASIAESPVFSKLWKNKKELGLFAGGAIAHGLGQDTYRKYKLGSDMMRAQREAEAAQG